MPVGEFLRRCHGRVRITLVDGSVHTGRFRTDILGPSALSAFFHGDVRDMSLPIGLITSLEMLGHERIVS